MDAYDALKASSLLKGFTDTGLNILASIAQEVRFHGGAALFQEGTASDALYILAEGKVALSLKGETGAQVPLGVLGPGECLGELALATASTRQCTANAWGDVVAFRIARQDFQTLTPQKPQACMKLLLAVVSRLSLQVAEQRDGLRALAERSTA